MEKAIDYCKKYTKREYTIEFEAYKKFFKKTHRYEPHNCGITASIIYEENNDISNVIAKICEENA